MFFSYDFVGENSWNGYEHNCLFANVGDGQFVDVARPSGADGIGDGRGVAVADFNADGRLDLAINNNAQRPTLYLNRLDAGNWLRLKLIGSSSNRDAVGARVALTLAGAGAGKTLTRWVEAGSGYASQSAFPVHFGLGDSERVEQVEITWPSGGVTRLAGADLGINRMVSVSEAEARASAAAALQSPESRAGG